MKPELEALTQWEQDTGKPALAAEANAFIDGFLAAAAQPSRGMMTAEQLREAWANWNMDGTYIKKLSLADCRIIDERVIAFAESLRAQLAEKERECKEQEIMLGQRNFEIGQLKGMFQKNFTWIDNGTCLELHNRRAEVAEQRLQEAQARIKTLEESR